MTDESPREQYLQRRVRSLEWATLALCIMVGALVVPLISLATTPSSDGPAQAQAFNIQFIDSQGVARPGRVTRQPDGNFLVTPP